MELFGQTISIGSGIFLLLALGMALSFEFVNGFHDTANAVATVIYTHTLKPTVAVVWSGCWNLIGVLTSTGAVAFGVLALLPVELVLNVGSGAGFAMVFALLISAIIWNLGTWYFGLPASSSHTLIGSIMGVGLANSLVVARRMSSARASTGPRRPKWALSLLVSPIVGFGCAFLLLLLCKALIKRKDLYMAPEKDKTPPLWIRGLLILTCTGRELRARIQRRPEGHGPDHADPGRHSAAQFRGGPGNQPVRHHQHGGDHRRTISFQMDRHSPGVAMGGYQIAADELSAYLKTTGK